METTVATGPSKYATGPIRDIAIPLAAVIGTFTLPIMWIITLYIVIGQAHFFTAYRYQYKGGRMNFVYIVTAAVLALGLSWYLLAHGPIAPLLAVSGILFAMHFALDEFTLHAESLSHEKILSVVAFTAIFAGLVIHFITQLPVWIPAVLGLLVLGCVLVRVFMFMRAPASHAEVYLGYIAVLIIILSFVFKLPGSILGIILLLHFINWYVGYGGRVRGNPSRAQSYWLEVFVTLAIMVVLYGAYVLGHQGYLFAFFGIGSYYAWAIAHIVLSFIASLPRARTISA